MKIIHKKKIRNNFCEFRFPNDANTYNIDQQFLIGRAILVSPNLKMVNKYILKSHLNF